MNPYLTSRQLQCGQGLGYRPGSVDISGSSYDRIDQYYEIHVSYQLLLVKWKRLLIHESV